VIGNSAIGRGGIPPVRWAIVALASSIARRAIPSGTAAIVVTQLKPEE